MGYKDPFQDPNWLRRALSRPLVLEDKWVAGGFAFLSGMFILAAFLGLAPLSPISQVIRGAAAPIIAATARPVAVIRDGIDDLVNFHNLRAENTMLRSENERLKVWYQESLRLEAENKSLRALSSLPLETPYFDLTARVLSDPGGPFLRSLIVRAGQNDGVMAGDIAIANGGVIGRVTEAGQHTARVLLLSDINARIPVVSQESRAKAILAGSGKNDLIVTQQAEKGSYQVGERLVTSGDDGIYAADLPVAIVTQSDANGVRARPLSDSQRIHHLRLVRYRE